MHLDEQNLPNPFSQQGSSSHVGMTVDWGDDEERGKGAAEGEMEEWEEQQSMSDREEEDHFMGC